MIQIESEMMSQIKSEIMSQIEYENVSQKVNGKPSLFVGSKIRTEK